MKHDISKEKSIRSIDFTNFEDFMGITMTGGFESILVPGSAYQNYDTFRDEVG